MNKIYFTFILFIASIRVFGVENTSCYKFTQDKEFTRKCPNNLATCNKIHYDVFADLLYWHMGAVGLVPNSTIDLSTVTSLTPTLQSLYEFNNSLYLNNINFGWDLGGRAGISLYNIGNCKWNLSLYYTYFNTHGKNSGAVQDVIGVPTGYPLTAALQETLSWLFAGISWEAKWNLIYNMFDFDLDHLYQFSRSVLLRPYIGIKGGWINHKFNIYSDYLFTPALPLPPPIVPAIENLKQNFWGIGPKAGLISKWCLGSIRNYSYYLFGNFGGAFMWSHWRMSDDLKIGETIKGNCNVKSRYTGSLMFQGIGGFEWNVKCNKRGAIFSARFSYETQFWIDQLQLFNTYNGRLHSILTLQGGTFDFRFDY